MNLANKLTLFRVILVPFFIAALMLPFIPFGYTIALVIFALASFTDMLDGKVARKYNMDPALAEQIARLYVTHPGVTEDGIMAKMGL